MMIKRTIYLKALQAWRDKQVIKVVTGVRRCGKSTLFQQYIDLLLAEGVEQEQIIYINLEDLAFESLLDYRELHNYIAKRLINSGMTYVFLDEIQQCLNFEKAVDSLYVKENVDLYITGSNANLLSGELATLLSGRYVLIEMLPLSFKEFVTSSALSESVREKFNRYLHFGSFPFLTQLEESETTFRTYIEGIYSTILIKDVASREGIADITLLEDIIRFLSSSIGSPISAKRISDGINASGRKVSVNTVDKYLKALTESFIFYKADRFDIKGRNLLKTLSKYYIVDTGLRNYLLPPASPDLGHQIENIVYLELLRREFRVNVGKVGDREVDFVASEKGQLIYYQVATTVLAEETLKRELEAFSGISDNFPRVLLTLDDIPAYANHSGVHQVYLLDWLLEMNRAY
ncbi:MAG TPA: ATP-binding protein [Anaerolineaceae bacterium]|nr:ATP-binding protein [Anaerolineaceae bacterium]